MEDTAWQPPRLRRDGLALGVVVLVLVGLYAASMPRGITLEDAGNFVMASAGLGLAHPPGFPLYTLLGKMFSLLPFGTVALRVALLSVVCGALCCGLVGWIVRGLSGSLWYGCAAAMLAGLSRVFWSQAVIAEVYTLHACLFLVCLVLALELRAREGRGPWGWLGLVYGLAFSNHWVLLGVATPALLGVLAPVWRPGLRALPRFLGMFLLGLLPWGYMVLRSLAGPAVSFSGPLDTPARVWSFLSREIYSAQRPTPNVQFGDYALYFGFYFRELAVQLTPVGLLLGALGLGELWKRRQRTTALGLAAAGFCNSFLLLFFFRIYWGPRGQAVIRVFPMLGYLLLAIAAGVGLGVLVRWLRTRYDELAEPAVRGLTIVLGLWLLVAGWGANDRSAETWSEDYGRAVLAIPADSALVIINGDIDLCVLGYLHHVEGVRPDLELVSARGLILAGGPIAPVWNPRESGRNPDAELVAAIEGSDREVYYTGWKFQHPFTELDLGLLRKIDPQERSGKLQVGLLPSVRAYFSQVLETENLRDAWTIDHRLTLIHRLMRVAGPVYLATREDELRPLIDRANRTPVATLVFVDTLLEQSRPEALLPELDRVEPLLDSTTPVPVRAMLPYLRGRLREREGSAPAAERHYLASLEIYPDPRKNPAYARLLRLYEAAAPDRVAALRARFE